jgi:hypothetical protein
MPMSAPIIRSRVARLDTCNDQVVGAILSGWRYDISGISPELRGDYETQRIHRTVDVLLLAVTTLSFAVFLFVALLLHRFEQFAHIPPAHVVHLHNETVGAFSRLPDSIAISLEALACVGVFVSMLLWVLVAIATPIPAMVQAVFRSRRSSDLHKQAA